MVASGCGVRAHELPGKTAFPENVDADPETGFFYTGSLIDGTVFRGKLNSPAVEVFLPVGGAYGPKNVAGVKVNGRNRLWVIDSYRGNVLVYDAGKEVEHPRLLHTFVLEGKTEPPVTPTVNDLAFSQEFVFVTDSARPFLYHLPVIAADTPGTTTVQPWLTVDPPIFYAHAEIPFSVNLNGIVASPDGKTLLTIQSDTGILYRVDVEQRTISRVAVRREEKYTLAAAQESSADGDPFYSFVMNIFLMNPLFCGDGLLRVNNYLYLTRNVTNEIVTLELSEDYHSADLKSRRTDAAFAFPTGLARLGDRLLVANSQLNLSGNPEKVKLPFTVVDLPLWH